MTKTEEKPEKSTIFVYPTEENEAYVEKLSNEFGLAKSAIVNRIIEGHRTNKKIKFEKHIPKYVQRAEQWKNKSE